MQQSIAAIRGAEKSELIFRYSAEREQMEQVATNKYDDGFLAI